MSRRRALISVWDKTGVVGFARSLAEMGWELLSTGGTARVLREAGVDAVDIAVVTGHPEMMAGRVKTLHPAVHAGLLARRDRPGDMAALAARGYEPIDLVAVNLYPFRETVASPGATMELAMERVDIGGPTLLRAAAKNHRDLWAVVDPGDYGTVLEAVGAEEHPAGVAGRPARRALRRRLAAKVFREVARYDGAVSRYLADPGKGLADEVAIFLDRHGKELRYGENPGQQGAFYRLDGLKRGIAELEQLHGKLLSYNNILDLDGALSSLAPFAAADPAACIVKHGTPSGIAVGGTLAQAFERARLTDPVSAFGGVVAANRQVDEECAAAIASIFVECVVAPGFGAEAMELLSAKKGLRVLAFPGGGVDGAGGVDFLARAGGGEGALGYRSVYGGFLAQSLPAPPSCQGDGARWRVVTEREPSESERNDLAFAWAAVAGVKSNAILLARDLATVGIGAGQTSRVDSSRLAVRKAKAAGLGDELKGSVLASDAFFPFRDGVDAAAEAGVRAIVQPGGSIRDREVVAAADEHGIAMAMTGRRLFKH